MTEPITIEQEEAVAKARILCVDDEPCILSSLRRLFRANRYHILTAESGNAGLKLLETEQVDVVISDMRMPEMDGAQFLEHVHERWPDTARLLLTGYADIQSILAALNRGGIYRYIAKPWDDNEILLAVRHSLQHKALQREKQRLEELTRLQNEELKILNARLDAEVQARTAALKKAHDELVSFNNKLKNNFLTSIKVFSNLIERHGHTLAGHSWRVAEMARKIANHLELNPVETQEIFIAALLHHIGKVEFPIEMLTLPVSLMNDEQLRIYYKYPVHGEQLLIPLEDLRGAARIIRSHQESFDGQGFPDRLAGFNIPLGARILRLASDYNNLQTGMLDQHHRFPEEAAQDIVKNGGTRYDPVVVNAFQAIISERIDNDAVLEEAQEEGIDVVSLRPGMVTTHDLLTREGFLLLSADHTLTEPIIQQLLEFEKSSQTKLAVRVR